MSGFLVSMDIVGDKAVIDRFAQFPRRLQNRLVGHSLYKGAQMAKAASEALIPVDTSKPDNIHLRNMGLNIVPIKNKRRGIGFLVRTPTRSQLGLPDWGLLKWYYPAHLELGHKNAAPVAYMRRGANAVRGEIVQMIYNDIAALIDRGV